MCCKNSDYRRYCKEGQAPFPYGPRRKLVCCQCPTGEVLNDGKNGCVSTGAPSPSSTAKPTLMPTCRPTPPTYYPTPHGPTPEPTYQPTPAPTYQPTPAPTNQPTEPPTHNPTPHGPTPAPSNEPTPAPTYQPTPAPTYQPTEPPTHNPTPHGPTPAPSNEPTPAPTYQPTPAPTPEETSDPTKPVCEDGFELKSSDLPILDVALASKPVEPGFEMCCQDVNPPYVFSAPKVLLYYEKMVGAVSTFQTMKCYCINGQTWHRATYNPDTKAVCR
jgi:hypothetical protein